VTTAGKHTIEARLYDSILPDTLYSSSNTEPVEVAFSQGEYLGGWIVRNWLALLLVPVVIVLLILMFLMRRQIARGVRATTSRIRQVTQVLAPAKAKLVIVRGPNTGQEFRLMNKTVRIGRGEGLVEFVLTDPSVSNIHAILTEDQLGYSIADLGSANGTLVNNQPLQKGQQGQPGPSTLLQYGSTIRMGTTELRLDRIGGTTHVLGP
jgi:hypothetical protein